MRSMKTKNLTLFAFFLAVELVLLFTPLGFLRIGPLSATLMHIPVIIASITMGWKYGACLGLVFGLCSVWNATFAPSITSFCFSPFMSFGEYQGNFSSLIIAIVPRILIGLLSALVYSALRKRNINEHGSIIASALTGSFVNTVLVLGLIYIFFGASYAAVTNISYEALIGVLMGVVFTNGIAEAVIGCIVALTVCKALKPMLRKK